MMLIRLLMVMLLTSSSALFCAVKSNTWFNAFTDQQIIDDETYFAKYYLNERHYNFEQESNKQIASFYAWLDKCSEGKCSGEELEKLIKDFETNSKRSLPAMKVLSELIATNKEQQNKDKK